MKELNSNTLKSALRNLRLFQPRDSLWERISTGLNEESQNRLSTSDQGLKYAIKKLPLYQAPASVWRQIQHGLEFRAKKKFYLRLAAIAASLLLLVTTTLYLAALYSAKPDGPIAEKQANQVPITSAEIAEYENQMASEEKALQDCLEKNRNAQDEEVEVAVQKLKELTATRDSLSLLLKAGNSRPGTSPRLSRLEQRRKQIILELHNQLCEPEQ